MNRETTTLCVLAAWAMATLVLPTSSYPSNAFSGIAENLVCLESRFSAARIFYDLRAFDKMVVNSPKYTKQSNKE